MNGSTSPAPDQSVDLQLEVEKRKTWFYETQLRRLNFDRFQEIRPDQPGPMLDLISEPQLTVVFLGQFGRLEDLGPVYHDSQRPVWTADDKARHDGLAASLLGRVGDFLNAREPLKLAARLKALRDEYEASAFGSVTDPLGVLGQFPRSRPEPDPDNVPDDPARPEDNVAMAISRAELAAAKPWLIPELYNATPDDVKDARVWLTSLERYIADYEAELAAIVGEVAGAAIPFDLDAPATYRGFLAGMLTAAPTRPADEAVDVRMIELSKEKPDDDEETYTYRFLIATNGSPMGPVANYRLSERVKYWSGVFHKPLKECVALKPNSDMGLCQLVRLLYRYGTLPQGMGTDRDLTWRRRVPPDETLSQFFAQRAMAIGDDTELRRRLQTAETKLRIILEEAATQPRSPDPSFSPLAGEILKQGLLSYKYWLDEKPRALDNERLNKVKTDLGFQDEGVDCEMEFWSENHYIMFASSEYLLGQLWQDEIFQPCRLFVDAVDTTGARTGVQRRDRGRARVLKWLNNRLMFGWMEFNSSGYYREHLWALLNLVDFALDEEVRTKAAMAVDLMLFDVTRYLHRGAMGAAGGRSQFKSKSHGYDNGLTDVVEIMLGVKGVFSEGDAQVAASFASSTYDVPQVLLEIGAAPPTYSFTDRSRVSITFDESAKYGITWSQDSVAKDSLMRGYADKRARYSPFLAEVNKEIARTHDDYGQVEDDTVFFWGMSAFFNKQVVRNTNRVVKRFGLKKSEAFKTTGLLLDLVQFFKAPESALLGFSIASIPDRAVGALTGEGSDEIDEETADDLSLVLEGSTRTRANIVTYRSPGATQSSIQNFRYGQLNFQSSIQQATLNGAVNVFVTTGFGGLDISDLATFGAGALAGGLIAGPLGAVGGGIGAVVASNEALQDTNPLNPSHEDGPEWWTGYWALPRVMQHGGAVIMLSEFHDIQDFLAETGSHAWFPKSGFDRVVERRTSAYDDANFPLLEIGHIGPKGFWLFGKVVHPVPEGSTAEPEEGYVGVFSNKRPEWLTKESDPYDHRLEERIEKDGDDRIWKDAPDLFADKDWYVNGKNIWIVQVGSRTEFGSFETFMDRVSSARVHVDDTGDLECTYDVPRPGGGSDRLRLTNGDDAEFELNGQPLAVDLFPRFENPFVRSGVVEWGQRTYCLEWNGQTLLHDFSDSRHPVRQVAPVEKPGDAESVLALVIHLRTGDEAMEVFTVATATVDIGCQRATTEQVVAAGPVGEDTQHDVEWIFLDQPMKRSPDMVLALGHPASGGDPTDLSFLDPLEILDLNPSALLGPLSLLGEAGSPEWEVSYSLKALMGDRRLRECSLSFSYFEFEDEKRHAGPFPFSVSLSEWRPWERIENNKAPTFWIIARHPEFTKYYYDYNDLLALDQNGRLWHRRLMSCQAAEKGWLPVATGGNERSDLASWFSVAAVSAQPQSLFLFVQSKGNLFASWPSPSGDWPADWNKVAVYIYPDLPLFGVPNTSAAQIPVALGSLSTVVAVPSSLSTDGAEIFVLAADGHFYSHPDWRPNNTGPWRKLDVSGFSPLFGADFVVVGDFLFVLAGDRTLWAAALDHSALHFVPGWERVTIPGLSLSHFTATCEKGICQIVAATTAGALWATSYAAGNAPTWVELDLQGARVSLAVPLTSTVPSAGRAQFFASGADGRVYTIGWETGAGWSSSRQWSAVEPGSQGFAPQVTQGMAAISRVNGQIELFVQGADNELFKAWWS